jgi:pimeloyl-ACP methyl ester carboxylesterase
MNQHDLSRRGVLTLAGGAAIAITQGHSAAYAATRPTAKLFMTEVGTGRNVMLLHGWTCDSHDWSWQLPLFEGKYRVVAADLRGHGRSEVMPSGGYIEGHRHASAERRARLSDAYLGGSEEKRAEGLAQDVPRHPLASKDRNSKNDQR